MRYTLEQLKAMSDYELKYMWENGMFPFDTARCGHCVTQHGTPGKHWDCEHVDFRNSVLPLWGEIQHVELWVRPVLEEIFALRMFFDHLYPQPTQEQIEQDHKQVLEAAIQREKAEVEASFARMEQNELEFRAGLTDGWED